MSHSHVSPCAARAALSLATLFTLAHPVSAQQYPSHNITFIVGFAAGGVADGIGRLVGQKLGERLGQSVIVENRGGAGGNIAAKAVAGAAPDGYTVLVTTTALAINETMQKNKGFSAADFATVAIAASSPEVLATHPDNPGKNIGEYLAATKGKPINFGTAGAGSGSHIAAEYFFKVLAKVPATHVPFQGGAPALNAAIANHIDLIATTVGGGPAAQIKADKLKGLAMASEQRIAVTPNVPSYAEGGYPNFTASSWVGFFVPAKTDPQVVAKLNAAIDAVVKDPEVQQRLATLGFDPVTGASARAEALFKSEVEKWGKMVSAVGITVD
jgi:tripartite-type tricarboxylate transporter receptor subunit TctC